MKLGITKTVIFDVTDSVFERCKEAFLYITKDELYSESYIVAVPAIHLTYSFHTNDLEKGFQRLLKDEARLPDRIIRENLVKAIRESLEEFA